MTLVRLLQPENAVLPILVILSGIVILVRLLQPENALLPILVRLFGIVMLGSLLQPENALFPILVTLLGIVMLVRKLQPANALSGILVMPFGIEMLVKLLQPENAALPMLVTGKPLTADGMVTAPLIASSASNRRTVDFLVKKDRLPTTTTGSTTARVNASLPKLMTLSGIVMLVRARQS